ncbi:hypothetical protein, partial [Nostoc sp. 'Peltigera membranacea cyanobiont' 232]|uniref:hypothetical protein n=1 Tax=Nostoc sp. 'Peltigera membranacea cyanobiont' 232 TaxID=2014531 RepID=UPI001CB9CFF7
PSALCLLPSALKRVTFHHHQKLPITHNFAEVNWKYRFAIPAILSFHRQSACLQFHPPMFAVRYI